MPEAHRSEVVDWYEVLEVSPRATQGVIQAAYRALVRKYHLDFDASAEAAQRSRQLTAAYQVLGDPEGRARYDLERAQAEQVAPSEQPATAAFSPTLRRAHLASPRPRAMPQPTYGGTVVLNGQVIVGLLLVGILAAIMVMLAWAAILDPTSDDTAMYSAPVIEFSAR